MSPSKTLSAALALGLAALATPALADESVLSGVKSMNVMAHGAPPVVTVRNVAANHNLASLKLAVQENQIPLSVGGAVDCLGTTSENLTWRHGTYLRDGAFGIGRTSLLLSKQVPYSGDIDRVSKMDAQTFQLPVAQLAHPQIGVDPVAVVLRHADKAPDRLHYLRQNHVIIEQIPIRWESTCATYSRNKISKKTIIEAYDQPLSHVVKYANLRIEYQGDPQLFAVNVNAQLGQGQGLPNQVEVGAQPFKITSMQFQPNMPHHIGACPAKTMLRVSYMGQGKGEIRIRINEGGKTIHNSSVIAFDSKNGWQHYDFEIATPK
ncbi:MAG: hypothetical protein ACM35H_02840, partial [Bacteroidota bacterium]|nr:hypothetical protein [Kiloniellaceae bacterium]